MIIKYRNKSDRSVIIIIGPWAEEISIDPESVALIHSSEESIDELSMEAGDGYCTLWIHAGHTAGISVDGKDVTPKSLSIPAAF
jgi:hypothetical protein